MIVRVWNCICLILIVIHHSAIYFRNSVSLYPYIFPLALMFVTETEVLLTRGMNRKLLLWVNSAQRSLISWYILYHWQGNKLWKKILFCWDRDLFQKHFRDFKSLPKEPMASTFQNGGTKATTLYTVNGNTVCYAIPLHPCSRSFLFLLKWITSKFTFFFKEN